MANLSDLTRSEQVLAYLSERWGQWVNGMEVMNEAVGGQRGGARIKDLRDAGYVIESRRHPDPAVDQWQYRIVGKPMTPMTPAVPTCSTCGKPLTHVQRLLGGYAQGRCYDHKAQVVRV